MLFLFIYLFIYLFYRLAIDQLQNVLLKVVIRIDFVWLAVFL